MCEPATLFYFHATELNQFQPHEYRNDTKLQGICKYFIMLIC